jgi:hypothetical protein
MAHKIENTHIHTFNNMTSALARQQQLERLKTDLPDLYAMITCWINDMLCFSSNQQARERLQVPTRVDDNVPPFFNEVYFTSDEAKYLAKQMLPSGDSLGTAFQSLLDDRASAGSTEVCTSHDLAPFLREAFDIPSHFYKSEGFKKNYKTFEKEWRKRQKKLAKQRGL